MALLDALVVVLAATRAALLTSNALQPPSRPHVSSRAFVVAEASAPPSRREARASEAAAKLKAPAAATPPPKGAVWVPPDVPETVAKLLKPSRIRKGDYVVHRKFGVGRFEGLFALKTVRIMKDGSEIPMKVLKVHFRDGDLEVPVEMKADLKLFKRRDEDGDSLDTVRLDSMRSSRTWERRKERAAKKVLTVAADLLNIYAQRQHLRRPPCAPDGDRFAKFADAFEFSPTADQLRCFDEVRDDMVASDRPMDRLVCGDVGFGKTEVALRAVYRAVCSGKQVAFLAPTTVLAAQHLRVLQKRMGSDVRVELLSSLVKRTRDETAALREEMADPEGDVDVVVGTHALLADKVEWGRLGLLIVDEEQRFGVKQKERIKQKATEVDVLSLSATPIPRTLYMCLSGIRNMSVLATPPEGRLSVQTTLMERDDARMELAIRAELERGGQVFYVVPRIEMIADEVALLEQLLPDRTISYAHGGMRDLEKRVVSFTLGEVDVMVATTILENGIDIPNVNTIVIQHTHLFGLSQLHQLRGRVGRSNLQAYAYMMHPSPRELTEVALKRLRALKREGGLGAGFALAKEDMQLRGAGSLLGTAQKGGGGAAELGVDLYLEILQKAMAWLEQQKELGLDVSKVDSDQLAAAIGVSDLTEAIGLADSMDG